MWLQRRLLPVGGAAAVLVVTCEKIRHIMWARRCGADNVVVRRVGRWLDLMTLMEYVGEGADDVEEDDGGVDPAQRIWIFNTITKNVAAGEFIDDDVPQG